MSGRIKLPGWILLFLVIFLIIGGIDRLINVSIKAKSQEEIQEEKVISKYPKINLKTVTKQTDEYTYSINEPDIDSEKVNKSINKWIKDQKEKFVKEAEDNKEVQTDGMRADLNIQMETHRITEDYYSLVFRTYMINGGANGQNKVKVFNIDIVNDRFLEIGDILDLNKDNMEGIQKIVWEELHNNKDIQSYLLVEEFNQWVKHPEDWEWSIDRKNFSLYIDEYKIAAGAAGAIEIDVPVKKMYIYLQKDVDSFLKMPKEQKLEKEKIIQQEQLKLDPNGKYVALTFDDGPSPDVTPRILKALKEHNAKATFFMLGNQVDYYPELARKVAEEGHEIGNHSKSHPNLSKLGPKKIKEEMDYTKDKIAEATGITPHLLRPPYGAYNDHFVEYSKENGDSIILWSVDSLDWKIRNAFSVKKKVESSVAPGGIVLMHDIHPSTGDSLPNLLTQLEQEGYQFVTVSQLLNWKEEQGTGPHFGSLK
ncbi:polysaccharide deacetylase family protein [Siminovitchia fordii]|uniref:Peptidoglycan-N-acetylmuramic acid deacetylase PdaC n=1 Tax=Siminovitchia fordii TaxID=254759 RepID=A0ABQ4K7A5_9BACI|nr:polysaccharide deacetylase family protein [Siminovitchia fordii]GIN21491.1 peptidoglycan-N-acetylmuramic acid deacetylase PdaC [Siminovitchia fordii]